MFRVRPAKIEDYQKIVEFQIRMAQESEGVDLEQDIVSAGVLSVFDDPQKGKYYVAEDNQKVIASMLTTFEWSDWRNQTVYWLQSVYILPEYRGKHIFSKMYAHIKKIVLDNDQVAGIRLYVDERNDHAKNVYNAVGMNGNHYRTFEWMKDE